MKPKKTKEKNTKSQGRNTPQSAIRLTAPLYFSYAEKKGAYDRIRLVGCFADISLSTGNNLCFVLRQKEGSLRGSKALF